MDLEKEVREVCDRLGISMERWGSAVEDLLCTYAPDAITPEMVEEMDGVGI